MCRLAVGEYPTSTTVPSPVASVQVKALSPNLFHVMWEPSRSPNGVITGYIVQVSNLSSSAQPFIVLVPPNQHNVNISNGIGKYCFSHIPYISTINLVM